MISADELDRLRLAFTVAAARRVVLADGVEDPREQTVISQIFPMSMLRRAGLVDEEGELVAGVDEVAAGAGARLAAELPLSERLDLITLLFLTAAADGMIPDSELAVIKDAADRLEIPAAHGEQHLRRLVAEATEVS